MKLSKLGKIGAVAMTAAFLLYLAFIFLDSTVAIEIISSTGSSVGKWSTTIDGVVVERTSSKINLDLDDIRNKEVTIKADNFDEIILSLIPSKAVPTKVVVKLAPDDDTKKDDGTHQGIAMYKGGNSALKYFATPPTSTSFRVSTENNVYLHSTNVANSLATIGFALTGATDIFTLKIRKKKKNTQVDVYLDEARDY
jgi:hypothetical protein